MKKELGLISLICADIALVFILYLIIGGLMGITYGGLLLLYSIPFMVLGLIFGIIARVKKQKFSVLSLTLSIIEVAFLIFCIIGNM